MAQSHDAMEKESARIGSESDLSLKTLIRLGSEVFIWAFILLIPYLVINRLYGAKYLGMTASLITALILVLLQTLFKALDSETEKPEARTWLEVLISTGTLTSAVILGSLIDSAFGSHFSAIGPSFLFATFCAMMLAVSFGLIISIRTTPLIPFIQTRESSHSNVLLVVLAFIIFIMNIAFIGGVWILESTGISSTILTPLLSAACFVLVTAPSGFVYFLIRYDWEVDS